MIRIRPKIPPIVTVAGAGILDLHPSWYGPPTVKVKSIRKRIRVVHQKLVIRIKRIVENYRRGPNVMVPCGLCAGGPSRPSCLRCMGRGTMPKHGGPIIHHGTSLSIRKRYRIKDLEQFGFQKTGLVVEELDRNRIDQYLRAWNSTSDPKGKDRWESLLAQGGYFRPPLTWEELQQKYPNLGRQEEEETTRKKKVIRIRRASK